VWQRTLTSNIQRLSDVLKSLRVARAAYAPLPQTLTDAAVRGDIEAAKMFLDAGEDIQQRTIGFASPLHAACSYGQLGMAKWLHARGAKLVAPDEMFSCVHFAAAKGYVDIVEWAAEAGLPEEKVKEAWKILTQRKGLVGKGTTIGDEGRIEQPEKRRQLQEHVTKSFAEHKKSINEKDKEGFPLILRAVATRDEQIVRACIEAGADVNAQADVGGTTALIEACALGALEIVEYLIENGADVNQADNSRKTPLMHACVRGDARVVEMLIKHGADKKAKDISGNTCLKQITGPYKENLRALLKSKVTRR
jgi:ankyrin repeat protein